MSLWLINILARIGITATVTISPEYQVTVIVIDRQNKYITFTRHFKTYRFSWNKHNDKPEDTEQHIERK